MHHTLRIHPTQMKLTALLLLGLLVVPALASEPATRISGKGSQPSYTIDLREAERRVYQLEASFPARPGSSTTLRLPVWSPGSYLVREYAGNIATLRAYDGDGNPLSVERPSKDRWVIGHEPGQTVVARYEVYGGVLTVRTPYITGLRAAWQHASLLVSPVDEAIGRYTIQVLAPEGWQVDLIDTPLPGKRAHWSGDGLEDLYDGIGIAGPLESFPFEDRDRPFRLVFDGEGYGDGEELRRLSHAGIREVAEVFLEPGEEYPFDRYGILTSLGMGGGGLEHLRGTHLLWERWALGSLKERIRFLTLVVHEFWHVWNVELIKPASLVPYDYQAENYVYALFEIEGMASYYDILLSGRALGPDASAEEMNIWLDLWESEIRRFRSGPGRHHESLREASFDAWIQYYRQDENSPNTEISYYRKGSLVSALLDHHIRHETQGEKSLDDVWRLLWIDYLEAGSEYAGFDDHHGFPDAVQRATGIEVSDFFARYVEGTEALPLEKWLTEVGLELANPDSSAWLGAKVEADGSRLYLETVFRSGPADSAGLANGDELVALDGWRVAKAPGQPWENLEERLADYNAGDEVKLTIAREGRLMERKVRFGFDPEQRELVPVEAPDRQQAAAFTAWAGMEHPHAEGLDYQHVHPHSHTEHEVEGE